MNNYDICSPSLCTIFNDAIKNGVFPHSLKLADLTPVHKKDDSTDKSNYRPISILPTVSKIFERLMYNQAANYMNSYFSPYLCGFRSGYGTQYSLIRMLANWEDALDNKKIAGALLTDLSKAFDCIDYELLIAKLHAYGFDASALTLIASYLTDRKQRTKINNQFSNWGDITSGVPQGSILGPFKFNVYINDIFFLIENENLTNFADDNTPFTTGNNIIDIISNLETDSKKLLEWFEINFFKMNADKCKLLITNHENDISLSIGGHSITCEK